MMISPGKQLRSLLAIEKPLQMVGAINAYAALMAKECGFKALYLSGAGVANYSYGLPDVGATSLDNVLEDVQRITAVCDLPLLVDIDTGWGSPYTIERAIKLLIKAGAAGVHIEDQPFSKRCGHLEDKRIVTPEEMEERIKAAVSAKTDPDFVIMARTDAYSVEGLESALKRSVAYKKAGADMLFPEAIIRLEEYKAFKSATEIPILANMTEFGKTALFKVEELAQAGIDIVLYPLSAARAMNKAAMEVYRDIRSHGTQSASLDRMQTREELYAILKYKP